MSEWQEGWEGWGARQTDRETDSDTEREGVCVCVCVRAWMCMWPHMCVCVFVCLTVWEGRWGLRINLNNYNVMRHNCCLYYFCVGLFMVQEHAVNRGTKITSKVLRILESHTLSHFRWYKLTNQNHFWFQQQICQCFPYIKFQPCDKMGKCSLCLLTRYLVIYHMPLLVFPLWNISRICAGK